MSKARWTFVLAVLCIAAFGCSDGGSSIENPVAPAGVTSVTAEAQAAPVVICHFDVDDEDLYDSIVIEVNGNSLDRHLDNHGDCTTDAALGTENCSCAV
jgi:hypothetical protein